MRSRRTQPSSSLCYGRVRCAGNRRHYAAHDLRVIGYAPAGHAFDGTGHWAVGLLEHLCRIAPIQSLLKTQKKLKNIRVREKAPPTVLCAQRARFLNRRDLANQRHDFDRSRHRACAAMNVPWLMVRRKPRISILATGDEIVMPGDPVSRNQIVSSNAL